MADDKLLVDLGETKATDSALVQEVRIEGLKKTKADIVGRSVQSLLSATTLSEVLNGARESWKNLKSLGVFKENVTVSVQQARHPGKLSSMNYFDVVFCVEEKPTFHGSVQGHAGNQCGDAAFSFGLGDLFGRAKQLPMFPSIRFSRSGRL